MGSDSGNGFGQKVLWAALGLMAAAIMSLVGAWAVNINRDVQNLRDMQRDVLIRVRVIEADHQHWPNDR